MADVKEKTIKWGMTLFAVLLGLLGTTWLPSEQTILSKIVVLGGVAGLLGFEVGWKHFVDKKFTFMEGLSGLAIILLLVMMFSAIFGFGVPAIIANNANIVVLVGAVLVLFETWIQ